MLAKLPTELIDMVFGYYPNSFYMVNKQYTEKYLKIKYKNIRYKQWAHKALFKKRTRSTIYPYHLYVQQFQVELDDTVYKQHFFWTNLQSLTNCYNVEFGNHFDGIEPNVVEKLRDSMPWITEIGVFSFKNCREILETIQDWNSLKSIYLDSLLPIGSSQLLLPLVNLTTLILESAANETFVECGVLSNIKHLKINTWISEDLSNITTIFPSLKSFNFQHFPFLQGFFTIASLPKKLEKISMRFLDLIEYRINKESMSNISTCHATVECASNLSLISLYCSISKCKDFTLNIADMVLFSNKMRNIYCNEHVNKKKYESNGISFIILNKFEDLDDLALFECISHLVGQFNDLALISYFQQNSASDAFKEKRLEPADEAN